MFLLLGGTSALAATQLAKNSVGTKQIKKNAVATAKIKNSAITTNKIKNGAVTTAKIGDAAVTLRCNGDPNNTGFGAAEASVIFITGVRMATAKLFFWPD